MWPEAGRGQRIPHNGVLIRRLFLLDLAERCKEPQFSSNSWVASRQRTAIASPWQVSVGATCAMCSSFSVQVDMRGLALLHAGPAVDADVEEGSEPEEVDLEEEEEEDLEEVRRQGASRSRDVLDVVESVGSCGCANDAGGPRGGGRGGRGGGH